MRSTRTIVVLATTFYLFLAAVASGQRVLERAEILEIFQELTDQPRKTWVPAGTIEAVHREHVPARTDDSARISSEIEERVRTYLNGTSKVELSEDLQKLKLDAIPFNVRYELANEYTMNSTVVVKYDGSRFYWQIDVDSRQDSVQPNPELAGNFMVKSFDLNWNRKRVFAWDGQAYTTYTASGNHAIVDAAGRFPRGVNGPLTAGLVPWGHNHFSYDKLGAAEVSASEVLLDGISQIQMTVDWADGASATFNLDPAKGYAVTSCTLPVTFEIVAVYNCSDYRQVAGRWVPMSILVERRNAITDALLRSDQWTITSLDGALPQGDAFGVGLQADARVEYLSTVTDEPAVYTYSHSVDTEQLLAERLTYAASGDALRQNCATATLKQAALELGKPIPDSTLAALVGEAGQTSLYNMKQAARGAGLYCRAVQTDLATLKTLGEVKAILYIPGESHFVLLDRVDDRYVWLIDLTSDEFYYRRSVDFFPMEWSQGVALLLSSQPVTATLSDIDDATLGTLVGADGWDCTRVIQDEYIYFCDDLPGGCEGTYRYHWPRYGCEPAPAGTCTTKMMVRYQESPCIPDPVYYCTITCEWFYYYMRACK
ncbi:MAG: hypothetical protein JW741_22705 [Sedimentisphaerales bacterium]|nr:hypothetical protein [Sedimentisphaerales bacterium]